MEKSDIGPLGVMEELCTGDTKIGKQLGRDSQELLMWI